MESWNNFNQDEAGQDFLETEIVQAGNLENGETLIIGGIEFEVVDSSPQKGGIIKIKNKSGEVSELDAFTEVETPKREESADLAA